MKMPQISGFMEDVNTRRQFSFSSPELQDSPLELSYTEKFAIICRIERDGISAVKLRILKDGALRLQQLKEIQRFKLVGERGTIYQ